MLTDATTGDTPQVAAAFNTSWSVVRCYVGIDFDTGTELKHDSTDLDFSYRLVAAENGTQLYRWPNDGDPTLAGCSSVPGEKWSRFKIRMVLTGGTYCVLTSDGRFGFLDYSSSAITKSRFVIWARLS